MVTWTHLTLALRCQGRKGEERGTRAISKESRASFPHQVDAKTSSMRVWSRAAAPRTTPCKRWSSEKISSVILQRSKEELSRYSRCSLLWALAKDRRRSSKSWDRPSRRPVILSKLKVKPISRRDSDNNVSSLWLRRNSLPSHQRNLWLRHSLSLIALKFPWCWTENEFEMT